MLTTFLIELETAAEKITREDFPSEQAFIWWNAMLNELKAETLSCITEACEENNSYEECNSGS